MRQLSNVAQQVSVSHGKRPFFCLLKSAVLSLFLLLQAGCGLLPGLGGTPDPDNVASTFYELAALSRTAVFQGKPIPYRTRIEVQSQNQVSSSENGVSLDPQGDAAGLKTQEAQEAQETAVAENSEQPKKTEQSKKKAGAAEATGNVGDDDWSNESDSPKNAVPSAASPENMSELRELMDANSQLIQLADQAPDSRLGLERRALVDVDTARNVLHSQGYYGGEADFAIDWDLKPVVVTLSLKPGQRYVIGETFIHYFPWPIVPPQFPETYNRDFRTSLSRPAPGAPAVAADILDAVARVPQRLHRRGFPFAQVVGTRYEVNHNTRTLDAHIRIAPGRAATMGPIQVSGNDTVSSTYLERLVPWKLGSPWNNSQMESYQSILQQTGLFRSINIAPEHEQKLETPVNVQVVEGPPRSVAAGFRYSTDVGFGMNASWEHRNFFGNGEIVRVSMPIAEDKQEFATKFIKPAFLRSDQNLLGDFSVRKEKTTSYDQQAVTVQAGVDRRINRQWWVKGEGKLEIGNLTDSTGKSDYSYGGLAFSVRRDTTNRLFTPTRGSRVELTLAPHSGRYRSSFTTLLTKVDARMYYAPFDTSQLVLAGRMVLGTMWGASINVIPRSLRFFAGGGGSVRGYAEQAIGPRDAAHEPTGGISYQEWSLEARIGITKNIAVVPFVDAGMVYETNLPKLGKDLSWAAGLGLRYSTPIGPIRLDVAVPLDRRRGDDAYQFYISIGQAF